MKKSMIYFLVLAMPAVSFSQQTTDSVPSVKTDYLKKSKSQKTAAFILLGIGATTLAVASFADVDFDALGTLVFVGGAATIASIPLFIASAKNKRKAMQTTAGLKIERSTSVYKSAFVQNIYPALSLKFNLK